MARAGASSSARLGRRLGSGPSPDQLKFQILIEKVKRKRTKKMKAKQTREKTKTKNIVKVLIRIKVDISMWQKFSGKNQYRKSSENLHTAEKS